ncbi:MAG: carboxyl transferase domain-containing protein [Dehalococcoidales bacterium]
MDRQAALEELQRRREIAFEMGGPEKIARHRQRGHITARERIEALVDPGTFVETGMLSLFQLPGSDRLFPASKLHGFGRIDGRIVAIQSDDSTVLAGTGGGAGRGRSGVTARPTRGCPIIRFGESGGVHLQSVQGSIGVLGVTMPVTGLMTPRRVPRVIGIMGYCFGDPTWSASQSEFVVQVKGTCMAVSSPRVLGIALEEQTTPEELGGWKVHAEVTGQVDAFAEDDEHCARLMREFISYVPQNGEEETPRALTDDPPDRAADGVASTLPDDPELTYDMEEVIKALVDDGRYLVLKPFFAPALTVCLARLNGYTVGIIASQPLHNGGAIGPDECDKATDMVVMCDTFNIPLVFLVDTPGYAAGKDSEDKRFPTKSMHWLQALSMTTVPKLTVIVRKAYGLALTNMCGPTSAPDVSVALTTADIRPMSDEAAMRTVHKSRLEAAADPAAERDRILDEIEENAGPFQAAMNGMVDDIIQPQDVRRYLITRLEVLRERRGDFISSKLLQTWPTGF